MRTVHPVEAMLRPAGTVTLLVGIEELPDGDVFAYLGSRGRNVGVVVTGDDNIAAVRSAWDMGGHVFLTMPPADAVVKRADVEEG